MAPAAETGRSAAASRTSKANVTNHGAATLNGTESEQGRQAKGNGACTPRSERIISDLPTTLRRLSAVLLLLLLCGCSKAVASKQPETVLDNYSFSIGVWCAHMASIPSNRYWTIHTEHSNYLWQARNYAITNGWPRFSDKQGFVGTEGQQ